MKKLILILVTLAVLPGYSQDTENEHLGIIENMYQKVYSELDKEAVNDFFTEDFIGFNDGVEINKDSIYSILDNLTQTFNSEENKSHYFNRIDTFRLKETVETESSSLIIYEHHTEYIMDGAIIATMNWLESAYLVREEDHWKIKFLHTTRIK